MRFRVDGLGGKTVTRVVLRLYNKNPSSRGGDIYRTNNTSWRESRVRWNTAPPAIGNPIAKFAAVKTGIYNEIDVSSLVNGDGTYSLRIQSTNGDGASYDSRELANPPQLVVFTSP